MYSICARHYSSILDIAMREIKFLSSWNSHSNEGRLIRKQINKIIMMSHHDMSHHDKCYEENSIDLSDKKKTAVCVLH